MLAHRADDFLARGFGVVANHGHGCENVSRNTVSTLHGLLVDEGWLNGMQLVALRESLDRFDTSRRNVSHGRYARPSRASVDQDCSSTTFSFAATEFRTGHCKVFAQDIQ